MNADSMYAVLAGRKLRELRKRSGYSTGDFTSLSKCISQQQLYRYERGTNKIDLDTLASSLKLLDVNIKLFFEELEFEVQQELAKSNVEP